jgi:hypothetical protein
MRTTNVEFLRGIAGAKSLSALLLAAGLSLSLRAAEQFSSDSTNGWQAVSARAEISVSLPTCDCGLLHSAFGLSFRCDLRGRRWSLRLRGVSLSLKPI